MEDELKRRAEARIGTTISGKYRSESVLGVGGMAVVYAATHRNQKRVAIKMLHPELSLSGEVRARFMREGYAANTVDHPGAVAVLDDDTAEDGAAYLVMERLTGEEVEHLWERKGCRLDPRTVLSIADPLLSVLEAAHAKAIVHRDIKPANLYITRDGTLKVLDFGIARARDALSGSQKGTQTGMLMGTPAFMAPEQAIGKTSDVDGATDVWAVGATMFALLSGQQVHEGETSTALLIRAATQPARPLAAVVPGVDPRLAAVVDRALAFDKAHRWPGAAEMRAAVREAHVAMYGVQLTKEPLEEIMAEQLASGATVFAGSVPPGSVAPVAAAASGSVPPPMMGGATTVAPMGGLGGPLQSQHASYPSIHPSQSPSMAAPIAAWGPPGSGGSWPGIAPQPSAAPPPPKRASLLVPALVLGFAIVAGAGVIGVMVSKKDPSPVAVADTGSAQAPVVNEAPSPAPSASATAVATNDVDSVGPAPTVSGPPLVNPNRPGPVVVRPPTTAVVVTTAIATAPAPPPLATTVAPAPPPPPATTAAPAPPPPTATTPPPPAPVCKAQCTNNARSCKSRCKASYGIGRDRHDCQVGCEFVEKECKGRAGC